jgi:gliding motility-associated-like protein
VKSGVLYLSFFLLHVIQGFAQIDTEFWFAAPEVTNAHADRPIYLRISSMDQEATVTISVPANPSFSPVVRTLPPKSSVSVDMTSRIDMLENFTYDQINNKGLYIHSTSEITAYYEVLGSSGWGVVNCDIFTLKGKNALGKTFYTPFQNHWPNNSAVNSWSSFDIVAIEDSTYITITPANPIVGHAAGIPYTIMLNKGQTYSARASSVLASQHLHGSYISSTKPIAVTVKDDSIIQGSSYDLAGDQMVPVDLTGTQYVVTRGQEIANIDRIFICATQNATEIFINGNTTRDTILQAGETYGFPPPGLNTYITSDKPVYVFHIAGFGNELGGAILPPLGCTGSRRAAFTRPTEETFALNIVVKSGGENYFLLNGSSSLISASDFQAVPGTGGSWLAAQIKLSNLEFPTNFPGVLVNDSADFQLGVMNGSFSTGFRYGYFSDYAGLELGPDKIICSNDSLLLNAGFGKTSYLWSTGSNNQTIYAKDSTKYYVTITKGACTLSDSIRITFHPEIPYILSGDTTVCSNAGYKIEIDNVFNSYTWQDGSTKNHFIPKSTGYHWVEVSNQNGCKKRDSIFVTVNQAPLPVISYNQDLEKICWDSTVILDAGAGYMKYKWHTGDTIQIISSPHLPEYFVTVTDFNGCTDSARLQIDCSPVIRVYNLFTPDGNGINDVFFVKGLRPNKWILEVYSRWGDLVYYNRKYNNEFDGSGLESDIYYFILSHIEGKKTIKGWVQIVKDE